MTHKIVKVNHTNGDWCAIFLDGECLGANHNESEIMRDVYKKIGIEYESIWPNEEYWDLHGDYPDALPVDYVPLPFD